MTDLISAERFRVYLERTSVLAIYEQQGLDQTTLDKDVADFLASQRVIDSPTLAAQATVSADQLDGLWRYTATNTGDACVIADDAAPADNIVWFDKRPMLGIPSDLSDSDLLQHPKTKALAGIDAIMQRLADVAFFRADLGRKIDWLGIYGKFTGPARTRSGLFDPAVEPDRAHISGMAGVLILRTLGHETKPAYSLGVERQRQGSTNVDRLLYGQALYVSDVDAYIASGASFSLCGDPQDSTEINTPILGRDLSTITAHVDAEDYQVKSFLAITSDNHDHRQCYLAKLWVCFTLGQIEELGLSQEFDLEG